MTTVHLTAALVASPTVTAPLRVWTRSAARTLQVPPWTALRDVGGRSSPLALHWPSKDAAEIDDYSLDFTALLVDAGDTIASATASVDAGGPSVSFVLVAGAVVTLWLAGGTAGETFGLSLTVTAKSGRVWRPTAYLHVRSDDASSCS